MWRKMFRESLGGTPLALIAAGGLAIAGCAPRLPVVEVVQPAPPGTFAAPTTVTLTTENVAALVIAANNATIQRAQFARTNASNARVRAFADRVLMESQLAGSMIQQGLTSFRITPQPEATATQAERYARETVALMQAASGLDVDRLYLQSEIDSHRWEIGTLNSVIPTLPAGQVRDAATQLRDGLMARLMEAEQLQSAVGREVRQNDRFRNHRNNNWNNGRNNSRSGSGNHHR